LIYFAVKQDSQIFKVASIIIEKYMEKLIWRPKKEYSPVRKYADFVQIKVW